MFRTERLTAFCDGVIAIAITLLVLGLEVPSVHQVPDQQLLEYLRQSFHSVAGYVASFVLVGTYWLQHYAIFHYVTRANRVLVVLNGMFLLIVSFVPFPTGLQASYREDELAMVLYAATQAACGLTLLAIWIYASHRHRLIAPTVSDAVITSMSRRIATTPLISLVAIAVSFVSIDASRALFLAVPLVYLSHRVVDAGLESTDGQVDGAAP